ncbi:MAG: ATP-binding protein [Hyphomicrobiaceae bacterium]
MHQHQSMENAGASSPAPVERAPAAPAVPLPRPAVARRIAGPALAATGGLALAAFGRIAVPAGSLAGDGMIAAGLVVALAAVVLLARTPPSRPDDDTARHARLDNLEDRLETLADARWQLSERERRYRDLLDAQEHVIARRNAAGRITFVNSAFCRVFAVEPDSVTVSGFSPDVLSREELAPAEQGHRLEQVATASGPRWFLWSEHDVPGPGGRGRETQIVGRDVTAEREHAAALAEARDQAEAASRAKSRFLAAMSHEIRTPMNGILGMAELLRDTRQTGEQQSYVEAIDQSARTLLALIDEILDFSKIEAGRLALRHEPFDIEATVRSVVELMAAAAHEKGLEIAWTIEPDVPRRLVGDETRVRQILLNLVSNAVKFTERGGVQVAVHRAPAGGEYAAGRLALEVMDTGIGLAPEAAETLFGEFERVDPTAGGTGLGLAISRRLAHAMGGDVTLDSTPGRGATFTATLALEADSRGEVPQDATLAGLAGRRVLLAFGRLIERRALATMLRHAGALVDEANDPLAEAEMAAAGRAGLAYDMMVIDAEEGAEEAAAALAAARRLPGGDATRGVVLVDACRRRRLAPWRDAGFGGYLVRPVRPRALAARLAAPAAADDSAHADALDPAAGAASALARAVPRARVLIAEDNPINARLAGTMLARAGCEVEMAGDGEAACQLLESARAGEIPPFDLVMMDMHMPRLDGLAATRRLRALVAASPAGRPLPPIVAVTANAFAEDRQACLEAGMDDYLAKPFTRADIERLLSRWTDG